MYVTGCSLNSSFNSEELGFLPILVDGLLRAYYGKDMSQFITGLLSKIGLE